MPDWGVLYWNWSLSPAEMLRYSPAALFHTE
jgi:hypothetical protein